MELFVVNEFGMTYWLPVNYFGISRFEPPLIPTPIRPGVDKEKLFPTITAKFEIKFNPEAAFKTIQEGKSEPDDSAPKKKRKPRGKIFYAGDKVLAKKSSHDFFQKGEVLKGSYGYYHVKMNTGYISIFRATDLFKITKKPNKIQQEY